jgi:hypothetical protein
LRGFHAFEGKSAKRLAEGIDPTSRPRGVPTASGSPLPPPSKMPIPPCARSKSAPCPPEGGQAEVLATFTYAENCPATSGFLTRLIPCWPVKGPSPRSPQHPGLLAEDRFLVSSGCAGGLSYLDPRRTG